MNIQEVERAKKAINDLNENKRSSKDYEEKNEWHIPEPYRTEKVISELSSALEICNYQIAELTRIKEALEDKLMGYLDHPEDCQKTYVYGKYKITVKSGWIYSLDKEEYQILCGKFKPCFTPVTTRVSYDINKNVIRDIEKYGDQKDLDLLAKVITKKPSKINIKIQAGI